MTSSEVFNLILNMFSCCVNPAIVVPCQNDIVIGVDSSACFRDYHSKMNRFMKKLVRRIGRTERIPYGERTTRLALMQVIQFYY